MMTFSDLGSQPKGAWRSTVKREMRVVLAAPGRKRRPGMSWSSSVTGPLLPLQLTGLKTELHISECQNSKFDLAMELWLNDDGFGGFIEYCTDLFDRTTILRMSVEFERLLTELVARPTVAIHELAAFTEIRKRSRVGAQPPVSDRVQTKPKDLKQIKRKGIDLAT